jgi:hypothetical protein
MMNYKDLMAYEVNCDDPQVLEIIKLLKEKWADADRFRFIVANKTSVSPRMNDKHDYRLNNHWLQLIGNSIDNAMNQVREEMLR